MFQKLNRHCPELGPTTKGELKIGEEEGAPRRSPQNFKFPKMPSIGMRCDVMTGWGEQNLPIMEVGRGHLSLNRKGKTVFMCVV